MLGFDNLDDAVRELGDRVVRTSQGPFVKVSDLVELQKQARESKAEAEAVAASRPRIKTFAQAKVAAKRDPRLAPAPRPPIAPALVSVKT